MQHHFSDRQPARAIDEFNGAVGAPPSGERQAEAVVVKITRLAKAAFVGTRRRVCSLPVQEQPGINRRPQIIVPRIARIRWDKPAAEADRLGTLERMIG